MEHQLRTVSTAPSQETTDFSRLAYFQSLGQQGGVAYCDTLNFALHLSCATCLLLLGHMFQSEVDDGRTGRRKAQ